MLKWFLGKITRKLGLLRHVNWVITVCVGGKNVRIPVIGGVKAGNTEIWMIDLLDRLRKIKGGAFLDVGVNLGQTLIKLKSLKSEVEYIGFEPNPICVSYVRELIRENRFSNCVLVPAGLFKEERLIELEFFSPDDADSTASLIKNFRPDEKIYHKMLVPVFRFESIAGVFNPPQIGFIKIDVEGAELEVIEGLYSTIQSYRPIILLEILPVYSSENKIRRERQGKLEQIFRGLNYKVFRIVKSDNDTYVKLQRVEEIGIHSDLSCCDYIAIPEELEHETMKL
jgi:FkbM family methyltransferase